MKIVTSSAILILSCVLDHSQSSNPKLQTTNNKLQTTNFPKTKFPQSFIGNWKGTLEWTQAGKKEPQRVTMELRIQPSADTVGQYTWNLIYGTPAKDNRPYILKPVDTAKGHWVIDEINGIVLDQYWIANKFGGVFTVKNATIVNTYWIEKGKLYIEFLTYTSKPIATTGNGDEQIPFVDSYEVKSYQKAVLLKSE